MKKITLLLTLLLCVAGTAWAQFTVSSTALDLNTLAVGQSVPVVFKVNGTGVVDKYVATKDNSRGTYYNDFQETLNLNDYDYLYNVVKTSATTVALQDKYGYYMPGWATDDDGQYTNNKTNYSSVNENFVFEGDAASGYKLTSSQSNGADIRCVNNNRLGVGDNKTQIKFTFYAALTVAKKALVPVARQTALVSGNTYMIYNSANDGRRAYFLKQEGSALKGNACSNPSTYSVLNADYEINKYLWTVTKVEGAGNEITYTLRNVASNQYATINGVSNDATNLLIERWDASPATLAHSTTDAYNHTGSAVANSSIDGTTAFVVANTEKNNYWNGNAVGNFTTYDQNGHPIVFYTYTTRQYVTFSYKIVQAGKADINVFFHKEVGSAFPAIPSYVNASSSQIPTGTVAAEHDGQTFTINVTGYAEGFPYAEGSQVKIKLPRTPEIYFRCTTAGAQVLTTTPISVSNYAEESYYTWEIGGNWASGYTLKNVGANKYLTPTSNGNAATLNMTDFAEDLSRYDIVLHSNNYFFKINNSTKTYLSNNGGHQGPDKPLSTWDGGVLTDNQGAGDNGSKFIVYTVTEESVVDAWKAATLQLNNKPYVNFFNADYTAEINACATSNDCNTFDASHSKIAFDASKYYMFVSTQDESAAIYEDYANTNSDGYKAKYGTISGNRVPFLWKFQEITDGGAYNGKYYIQNPNGNYFAKCDFNTRLTTTPTTSQADATATVYTLTEEFIATPGAMNIRWWKGSTTTNQQTGVSTTTVSMDGTVKRNDDASLGSWNDITAGNEWYILPVESIDLVITAAGWASVNLPFAVQMPEGVTAYAVTKVEGNTVYGEEITDGIVPANTPVFVAGTEGTKALTILYDNKATYTRTNKLHGSTKPETVTAGQYYGLKANDSAASLVPYNLTTLPANKAVLAASHVLAEGGNAAELLFDFSGDATGIAPAISVGEKEVFYDLNGRVVAFPAHGVFVKSNGQKVLIK